MEVGKEISPRNAYRINLGIYVVHVLVGVISFLYIRFSPDPVGVTQTWEQMLPFLWSFPLYAPEFYFYLIMLILVWKKVKFVKYLIYFNMIGVLLFLSIGVLFGYSMMASMFIFVWFSLFELVSKGPLGALAYYLIMLCIWLFYFHNLIFWVKKIDWEKGDSK